MPTCAADGTSNVAAPFEVRCSTKKEGIPNAEMSMPIMQYCIPRSGGKTRSALCIKTMRTTRSMRKYLMIFVRMRKISHSIHRRCCKRIGAVKSATLSRNINDAAWPSSRTVRPAQPRAMSPGAADGERCCEGKERTPTHTSRLNSETAAETGEGSGDLPRRYLA